MTRSPARLPDGFGIRLHDDVELGPVLMSGSRFVRASPRAQEMLRDRSLLVTSDASAALAGKLLDLDLADPVPGALVGPGLESLTVVVPVRDNRAGVARLLAMLSPHVACIVVDDASDDPRALARLVDIHGARLIRLDHNVGPAAARGAGLRSVDTSLVAFVDSDVEVPAAALARLALQFADPGLGAVAPRIRSQGGHRWFERYEDARGSLDLGPASATVRPWSRVAYLPSACLVARVGALGSGFDPVLRSGEDVDLVWRMQAAGHRIRYAADIEARHDTRRSVTAWLGRKTFYGSSAAALAERHGDKVAPAVLTPVTATAVVGVLLQRRWSWGAAAACGAWMARDVGRRLPELPPKRRLAAVGSMGDAMARQTSGLVLRHWWPATLLLATRSTRARRAIAVMAVVDGIVTHRASGTELDPVRFTVARRLDDLAYGAGVWRGAARARSIRCLVPRWLPASPASRMPRT